MKNKFIKKYRIYILTVIAFILVCLVTGLICFDYYSRLQDTIQAETSDYMQEISKQMSTNISKTINDNFAVLKTVSSVLVNRDIDTAEDVQKVIQEHQNHWNYQNMMLIDAAGVAYDEQGQTVVLSNATYLQEVVANKTPSMSASQLINGKECIVFAIPLDNMVVGDMKISALAGAYDLSSFDKILSMTAFDGKGYAHIIRKDGTVVVRSSSPTAMQTGYNVLNSLSTAEFADAQNIETISANIVNNQDGHAEFKVGENHEYMTYTALTDLSWSLLSFVPVSAVNEKSNMMLQITLLLCSGITIVFSLLFAALMFSFVRNKRKLERIAYVDTVTQGNTMSRFTEIAKDLLGAKDGAQYALVYTNIEKFKVLNEQFGRAACDDLLRSLEMSIRCELKANESVGRQFADNFCVLVQYAAEKTLVERFERWQSEAFVQMKKNHLLWIAPIVEFGVYVIENNEIALEYMIDRAKLSLSEAGGDLQGKVRYAIYDERVRKLLFREKHLEDMMETALSNHEFLVYLQPKYNTDTEKISGAEALVRWNSKSEGMIYPDEFIPLFEKNGFVVRLDLFVFEEVCRTMRSWIDRGLTPVKVSVNCSRVHLKNPTFLNAYSEIANQYDLPKKIIEIELTESTVFENVDTLTKTIQEIHLAGFGCSMDDFGSGYSSLNLIQDIPVDTLKLDKIFFRTAARDTQRTESVVGSIISMSKALSMETVAEGVEERVQVDMLKRLGCDYIQGFYFAKPMPIESFEALAYADSMDQKGGA